MTKLTGTVLVCRREQNAVCLCVCMRVCAVDRRRQQDHTAVLKYLKRPFIWKRDYTWKKQNTGRTVWALTSQVLDSNPKAIIYRVLFEA